MANPLERSLAIANNNLDEIGALFARLGDLKHPNSKTLLAYRNANLALRQALKNKPASLRLARDIHAQLRDTISVNVKALLRDAAIGGQKSASDQLRAYGYNDTDYGSQDDIDALIEAALDAVESKVDAQGAALYALLYGDQDEGLILGDDARQGVLRPGDVLAGGAYWLAFLWWAAWADRVKGAPGGAGFSKQAVAALDHRTTDCCLRVHGQVQPLNGKFHLTGTPRFADHLDWSPFHNRCRTSIALYLPDFDDGLTQEMRNGAKVIMAEREAGGTGYRNPASATI